MIIRRKESWGEILYDTKTHSFENKIFEQIQGEPYPTQPLVLNVDLTFKCNMECIHCVAQDMAYQLGGVDEADLRVGDKLIDEINRSPFMVVVITGGEPLLPEYKEPLAVLINGLRGKGIIVDTNGTIFPSDKLIKRFLRKEVMVRVSWDVPNPKIEAKLRKYPRGMYENDLECMKKKEGLVKRLVASGVRVAIQTVLHRYNFSDNNFYNFPYKLRQLKVNDWFIQRFIPSHLVKEEDLEISEYERRIEMVSTAAEKLGIKCHQKKDRRHNCVFLLVKDGELYTQSDDEAGAKIFLGNIGKVDYFTLVSAADHKARYCP